MSSDVAETESQRPQRRCDDFGCDYVTLGGITGAHCAARWAPDPGGSESHLAQKSEKVSSLPPLISSPSFQPTSTKMPPKSIFRQPGTQHFQLVHRSQRDPLIHDPEASQHVLRAFERGNVAKVRSDLIVWLL